MPSLDLQGEHGEHGEVCQFVVLFDVSFDVAKFRGEVEGRALLARAFDPVDGILAMPVLVVGQAILIVGHV